MGSSSELPRAAALCIPRLYEGGAEKVMAHMAGWWAERGVHVHLVTFHVSPRDFPLHPAVRRTLLDDVPDAPFPGSIPGRRSPVTSARCGRFSCASCVKKAWSACPCSASWPA